MHCAVTCYKVIVGYGLENLNHDDFFSGHSDSTSGQLNISASIMQGSAIGPASYVVNAAYLTTVTAGNLMFKYANDTYIVIPAAMSTSGRQNRIM